MNNIFLCYCLGNPQIARYDETASVVEWPMAKERQMCLSCSVKPATTSSGTVPMCSDCKRLMTSPRGVTYEGDKKDRPKQAAQNTP